MLEKAVGQQREFKLLLTETVKGKKISENQKVQ